MIKLTPLLYESAKDMYTVINEKTCIQLIKKHAPKTYKNSRLGNTLYRGIKTEKMYMYADSMKSERKSLTGFGLEHNFYTLILDDVFTKNGYPNRSNAIVCSTSDIETRIYGESYIVIPFDNTPIAIAPQADIWRSFEKSIRGSLKSFNIAIESMYDYLKIYVSNISLPENLDDWKLNDIKKLFELSKKYKLKEKSSYQEMDSPVLEKIIGMSYPQIENAFNPTTNKFTLTNSDIMNTKGRLKYKEAWFNGKAILINSEILDDQFAQKIKI